MKLAGENMKSIAFSNMKIANLLIAVLLLSSCGKIQKIMDGTENLPNQIEETNKGMRSTNESIRKQKIAEALKMLKEEDNRANLIPIPFDMMSAAKTLAEALTPDETVLFMKNYILKIKKQQSADVFPPVDEEKFQHNRLADYYMIMLISGFLPDETVQAMIEKESKQGAYQDIMLSILKLRYDFNNDMMLVLAMLGLDPATKDAGGQYAVLDKNVKLDTLGKIQNAIRYNEKVEFICNLDFVDKVGLEIEGFPNNKIDSRNAKANWELILTRAQSDYRASSFSKDPAKNEQEVREYTTQYNQLIDRLKGKVEGK